MASPGDFQLHERLRADTIGLGQSRLCEIRLMNDSTWPWVLLVPGVAGIREIYQLQADQLVMMRAGLGSDRARGTGAIGRNELWHIGSIRRRHAHPFAGQR